MELFDQLGAEVEETWRRKNYNEDDFPAIAEDAAWHYEDGLLAGYLAAQMAVRARLRR